MSELENPTPEEMNKVLFSHLIISLATAAMQQMGKLVNPATNKADVNLDAAQSTIDMIEMLDAKTRGNLDSEETRLMQQTLTTLRLNYVDTAKSGPAEPVIPPPPAAEPPAEDKKKFTKKYD